MNASIKRNDRNDRVEKTGNRQNEERGTRERYALHGELVRANGLAKSWIKNFHTKAILGIGSSATTLLRAAANESRYAHSQDGCREDFHAD